MLGTGYVLYGSLQSGQCGSELREGAGRKLGKMLRVGCRLKDEVSRQVAVRAKS